MFLSRRKVLKGRGVIRALSKVCLSGRAERRAGRRLSTGRSARGPARFGGWSGPISSVAGHSAGHLAGPLAGPRVGLRAEGWLARGLARGLAAGRHQLPFVTMSAIMGGSVRVGLEDSLYIGKGKLAESNAAQVKAIRSIVETLSLEVATPEEAREMLSLKGGDQVAF